MININDLKKFGIDVEEVTRQHKGNYEVFLNSLADFAEDKNYEQMLAFLSSNDYKSAFTHAITLKRVSGRLNFSDLYNNLRILTDLLRSCEPVNTSEIVALLKKDYAKILEAINYIK